MKGYKCLSVQHKKLRTDFCLGVKQWTLFLLLSGSLLASSCSGTKQAGQTDSSIEQEKKEIEYLHRFIEANKLKVLGYSSEAIMLFHQCLEIKPEAAAVHHELAVLYVMQNSYLDALEHAKKAAELEPENQYYLTLYARMLYKAGYLKQSLSFYQKLVEQFPTPEYLYEYARILSLDKKNTDKALKVYAQIERIEGIQESSSLSKKALYEDKGDVQAAINELKILANAFPQHIQYRLYLAEQFANNHQWVEAEQEYQRAFASDKLKSLTALSYAEFLLIQDKISAAYPFIRLAMGDLDFDYSTKFKTLIKLNQHYSREIPTDSLMTWAQLAKLPDRSEMQLFIAGLYVKQQKLPEARDTYRSILSSYKENPDIWSMALELSMQLKDWKMVWEDSKEAVELFPNNPAYAMIHAQAAYQIKQYQSGYTALLASIPLVIDNQALEFSMYTMAGELAFRLEKWEDSFNYFEKAIRLDSSDVSLLNNYAYYLSLRNTRLQRALQLIKRCDSLKPNQPNYLDTYAWVLFRLGLYQEALDYMNRAIQLSGSPSFTYWEHKGDILFHLNQISEAIELWTKSLEMGNSSQVLKDKINSKKWSE